ncbi:MAG: hypothetical protein KUG79_13900 [Pseudomonadales bacterium]|nr:hypothetical protein [Pseudomonadales bacterium]
MNADQHLLTDIALTLGDHRIRPVYSVADEEKRLPAGRGSIKDIPTIGGRDNLRQAVMARLLTPMGELASLGHADFGSRLHELVGRVNTETTRNLMRLYIIESLKKEPRVEKISSITVSTVLRQPGMVSVELAVLPIKSADVITIGPFSFSLI